jgi:hypothetical protein
MGLIRAIWIVPKAKRRSASAINTRTVATISEHKRFGHFHHRALVVRRGGDFFVVRVVMKVISLDRK